MDDLQGPEVETIRLHVPYHPRILYECTAEESLAGLTKLLQDFFSIIVSDVDKNVIFLEYHWENSLRFLVSTEDGQNIAGSNGNFFLQFDVNLITK